MLYLFPLYPIPLYLIPVWHVIIVSVIPGSPNPTHLPTHSLKLQSTATAALTSQEEDDLRDLKEDPGVASSHPERRDPASDSVVQLLEKKVRGDS